MQMAHGELSVARPGTGREELRSAFLETRAATLKITAPLSAEDQQVQSMPDASPAKWHLGHTSWFFDIFLLSRFSSPVAGPQLNHIFNSYYDTIGAQHPRARRGLITRPSLDEVRAYRREVDAAICGFLDVASDPEWNAAAPLLKLGIQHEQQHQELILMDIKHLLFSNPGRPSYLPEYPSGACMLAARRQAPWLEFKEALVNIGASQEGFAFDNERPRHKAWTHAFRVGRHLVTCGDWLAFMEAGGYERPEFWLSEGWATAQAEGWRAPLYWSMQAPGRWTQFTLTGEREVRPREPVCHVSYYEADAFARWAGARLPTEQEWERAAGEVWPEKGTSLHPMPEPAAAGPGPQQVFGAVWQWTASAYGPYPGFRPLEGAAGEYNGKFMSGQMVLRGSACVTPPGHARLTYRNFYPPAARWAFSGVRLASDV